MKKLISILTFTALSFAFLHTASVTAQTPKELGLTAEGTVTDQLLEVRDGKIVWTVFVRILLRNNGSESIIFIQPATEPGYHTKASVEMLYQDLGGGVRLPETEEKVVFTYTETRQNDPRRYNRPSDQYLDYNGIFSQAAPPSPLRILAPHDYFLFAKSFVIQQTFVTNPEAPTHVFDGWDPSSNVPPGMSILDLPAFRIRFDYSFIKGLKKDPYAVGKAKDRWAQFGILPTDDNDEMTFTTERIIKPDPPPNDQLPSLFDRLYGKTKNADLQMELLQTGKDFSKDAFDANDGETWLGLFPENGKFVVRPAILRVKEYRIDIKNEVNGGTGLRKSISVDGESDPILLLKNADDIEHGPVTGVIHGINWPTVLKLERQGNKEAGKLRLHIGKGFTKNFTIGGKTYDMNVIQSSDGLAENLSLVLESGEKRQVIHTVSLNSGYLGDLYWVGDIDRDGKPDIFMSLWENDVVHNAVLFLSSHAENNDFVKQVANFWTAGE